MTSERDLLGLFARCAYPVSTDIDPRGYRWSEAYLDQALAEWRASAPQASQPPQGAGIADLRDAKWLDPECAHAGACQSLKFKGAASPLPAPQEPAASREYVLSMVDGLRACAENGDWEGFDETLAKLNAAMALYAAPAPVPEPELGACQHEWVSARNKVVQSGEVCLKCFAIRAEGASCPATALDASAGTREQATEVRGIFARPDDHAEVKEAAAKIGRRRARLAKRVAP